MPWVTSQQTTLNIKVHLRHDTSFPFSPANMADYIIFTKTLHVVHTAVFDMQRLSFADVILVVRYLLITYLVKPLSLF